MTDTVRFCSMTGDPDLLPERATDGSAGFDLKSNLFTLIHPNSEAGPALITTGLAVVIPDGYVGLIRDRSGWATKGITTRAGVIDSDYRGEIKIVMVNETNTPVFVDKGTKIAQLIVVPYLREVDYLTQEEFYSLEETDRGSGGFGHTDKGK